MEFVFDRTQADVDRVKYLNQRYLSRTITPEEIDEWVQDLKGVLNLSDLNRIEGNISALSDLLSAQVDTKEWNMGDIPRESDYSRILENIDALKDAWYSIKNTPKTPKHPLNTFQKWNDVERILYDLSVSYKKVVEAYYYCGEEVYTGEGVGIL